MSWLPSKEIAISSGREESVGGRGPVSLLSVNSMVKRVLICERVFSISPEILVRLR